MRAAPSVSSKWLLPRLASFVDANPDIELRLDGTNEPTDFRKENVDLEIRHGEGGWPGLFVESLGKERFFPLCAPSFFAAGSLAARDLLEHRLIHSVKSQMQWPRWFTEAGIEPAERWKRVLFDRSHMAALRSYPPTTVPPGTRFSKRRLCRAAAVPSRQEPVPHSEVRVAGSVEGREQTAPELELPMTILKWALIFLLVSIVAGVLGFTGISAASADIARFLFYIFVVIFLVLLILGLTIFRA